MLYRRAIIADFEGMHSVRMAVQENQLSDPGKVTFDNYALMLEKQGIGWVCEVKSQIVGFSIADLENSSIWALFVLPAFEGVGIGRKLHTLMVNWCFECTVLEKLWLSTDPATRAEAFYCKAGWEKSGVEENGEIRFKLKKHAWQKLQTIKEVK